MTSTPAIVALNVRDLDVLASMLASWLAAHMPDARDIRITDRSYPLGAGMSHEPILFDAAWHEGTAERAQGMVVRIKPLRNTVYPDDLFDQQYRLIELMHEHGAVRVPRPLWFEADPVILGAAFFVMDKVAGRVAVSCPPYSKSGWLVETAPAARRRLWEDSVSQLAAIQRVPVAQAGFLTLPGGRGVSSRKSIAGGDSSTGWTRRANAGCCAKPMTACKRPRQPSRGHRLG